MAQDFIELKVQINTVDLGTAKEQLKVVESKLRALKLNAGLDIGESQKLIDKKITSLNKSVKKLSLVGALNVAQTKANVDKVVDKLNLNVKATIKAEVDKNSVKKATESVEKSVAKSTGKSTGLGNTSDLDIKINHYQRRMALLKKTITSSDKFNVDTSSLDSLMQKVKSLNASMDSKTVSNYMKEYRLQFDELKSVSKISPKIDTKDMSQTIQLFQDKMKRAADQLNQSKSHKVDSTALKDLLAQSNALNSSMSSKQVTESIAKINNEMKNLTQTSKVVDSSMATAFKGMMMWSLAATAFYAPIRAIQSMTSEILAFDKQMTTIKRVMDEPSYKYAEMLQETIDMSNELGVSAKNALEVLSGFAKQGYGDGELSHLTRTTEMLQTLSDLTPEQSVNTLTSAMKNFNVTAADSVTIADKLNEVDNNYAVSTVDLSDSIRKASATAATFGVELDTLIGYTTAIGESTRESGSIIGNGLKTIFARISSNSAAIGALDEVGISIKNVGGEVKPVQDVLTELGGKWSSLSEEQRRNVAVSTAGMFQLSRFSALMNNFAKSQEVANVAAESSGSMQKEHAKYMESYEAKLAKLSNAWSEFSLAVGGAFLNSGLTAGIQALGDLAKIATVVSKYIGVLPVLLGSTGIAMMLLTTRGRALSVSLATNAISATGCIGKLKSLGVTLRSTNVATNLLSVGLKGLAAATGVGLVFVVIGSALEKLTASYYKNKEAQDKLAADNKLFMDSYSENESEINSLSNSYLELQKVMNSDTYDNETTSEYLSVQNELAKLLPQLKIGEDEYGNAILGNAAVVQNRIELAKEQLEVEKALNAEKAKEESEDTVKSAKKLVEKNNKKKGKSLAIDVNIAGNMLDSNKDAKENNHLIDKDELKNIDNVKKKIDELIQAKTKAAAAGKMDDVEKYDVVLKLLREGVREYGNYENEAKSALLTIRAESLKTMDSVLESIDGISNGNKDSISKIFSTATLDTSNVDTLEKYNDMIKSLAGNEDLMGSFSAFTKESEKLKNATDEDFKAISESADKNFSDIKKSMLKDSGLDKKSDEYKALGKAIDKSVSSEIDAEKQARNMSVSQGISIDMARAKVTTLIDEGEAISEVTDEMSDQIEKLKEFSSVGEEIIQVSEKQVSAINDATFAIQNLGLISELSTEQETLLANKIQLLSELYPTLSDNLNGSVEQRKKAIKIIEAENAANKVLLEGYALAADGKMSIEGQTTMIHLDETNKRILNINAEIEALDTLQEAYKKIMESYNKSINKAGESFNTSSANDLNTLRQEMNSQKVNSMYDVAYEKSKLNKAELAKETANQSKYTTSLSDTIKAIGEADKASKKSSSSSKKDTTESIYLSDNYKKAIDKLNTSMEKQQNIMNKYPSYSKEYRKALREQIKLKEKEIDLTNTEAALLKKQIKNGTIYQKGKQTVEKSKNSSSKTTKVSNSTSSSSLGYNGQYAELIKKYAAKEKINANLVAAVIKEESSFNKNAQSNLHKSVNQRAKGLMQLMDGTAKEQGVKNSFNAEQNIMGGTKYLRKMLDKFGGDVKLALRAYNAGPGNTNKSVNYTNNDYVKKVTNSYNAYLKKAGTSVTKVSNAAVKSMETSVSKTTTRKLSGWNGRITSKQGKRWGGYHNGVDIAANSGTRLDANISGKVIAAGKANTKKNGYLHSSYGNVVVVQDKNGDKHLYGHLEKALVKIGDTVKKGQAIAKTGNTGNSTGPHLHYTINQGKKQAMPEVTKARGKVKITTSKKVSTKGVVDKSQEAIDEAMSSYNSLISQISGSKAEIEEYISMINDSFIEEFDRKIQKRADKMTKRQNKKDRSTGDSEQYRADLKLDRADLNEQVKITKKKQKFLKELVKTKGLTKVEKDKLKDELEVISEALAGYTTDLVNNAAETIDSKHANKQNKIDIKDATMSKENSYRETVSQTGQNYLDSVNRERSALKSKTAQVKEDMAIALAGSKNKKVTAAKRREELATYNARKAELIDLKKTAQDLENLKVTVKITTYEDKIAKNDFNISKQQALQPLMNKTSTAYSKSIATEKKAVEEKAKTLKSELNYATKQSKMMKLGSEAMKAQKLKVQEITLAIIENAKALEDLAKDAYDIKLAKNDNSVGDIAYQLSRSQTYQNSLLDDNMKKYAELGTQIDLRRKNLKEMKKDSDIYLAQMSDKKLTSESKNEAKSNYLAKQLEIQQEQNELNTMYKSVADTVIDLYKQVYEKRRQLELDAINKERTAYQKLINDKISALQKLNEEDDHKDDKADYQKRIAELEKKIRNYANDDSRSGKYEKSMAEDELTELKKEYSKFMRDYETNNKIEAWQDDLENKEAELDDAVTATDKYFDNLVNDEEKFNKMRADFIKGNVATIKAEMSGMSTFISENMGDIGESIGKTLTNQIQYALAQIDELSEHNGVNTVGSTGGKVAQISDNYSGTPNTTPSAQSSTIKMVKNTNLYKTKFSNSTLGSKVPAVLAVIPKGTSISSYQLETDGKWYSVTYNSMKGYISKDDLSTSSSTSKTDSYGNTTTTTTTSDAFGNVTKTSKETSPSTSGITGTSLLDIDTSGKSSLLGTTKTYDAEGKVTSTTYKQAKTSDNAIKVLTSADKTSKTLETLAKDAKVSVMDVFSYYAKVKTSSGKTGYVPKSKLIGLATGGYTGDNVPSSGAIALLHKKELVLNAEQTAHILEAAKLMRNVSHINSPMIPNTINKQNNSDNSVENTIENLIHIENFNGSKKEVDNLQTEIMKGLRKSGFSTRKL